MHHSAQTAAGGNILGLLIAGVLVFGGFFYGYKALTTGEWLWWQARFTAQPQRLIILNQGTRIELTADDPRFAELTQALNEAISSGYYFASFGVSERTWQRLEQNSLLLEAVYAAPVRLRGGIAPTQRLRVQIGASVDGITRTLFRSNTDAWDRLPLILNTVEPLRAALTRLGFGA